MVIPGETDPRNGDARQSLKGRSRVILRRAEPGPQQVTCPPTMLSIPDYGPVFHVANPAKPRFRHGSHSNALTSINAISAVIKCAVRRFQMCSAVLWVPVCGGQAIMGRRLQQQRQREGCADAGQ